jgi:hypothetical protein
VELGERVVKQPEVDRFAALSGATSIGHVTVDVAGVEEPDKQLNDTSISSRYWNNGASAIEMSGEDDRGGADQLHMNVTYVVEYLLFFSRLFVDRGWIKRNARVDRGRVLVQVE